MILKLLHFISTLATCNSRRKMGLFSPFVDLSQESRVLSIFFVPYYQGRVPSENPGDPDHSVTTAAPRRQLGSCKYMHERERIFPMG